MNPQIFHPFVLPFVIGMVFVLTYCVVGLIRVISQLPKDDRKKFWPMLPLLDIFDHLNQNLLDLVGKNDIFLF